MTAEESLRLARLHIEFLERQADDLEAQLQKAWDENAVLLKHLLAYQLKDR
jgi:hypothetical protein